MDPSIEQLLFVDRFRPGLSGLEILMIQHLTLEMLSRNGLSDNARSVLRGISLELGDIISHHNITRPVDCFNIF